VRLAQAWRGKHGCSAACMPFWQGCQGSPSPSYVFLHLPSYEAGLAGPQGQPSNLAACLVCNFQKSELAYMLYVDSITNVMAS
jgi:hypothetical protein